MTTASSADISVDRLAHFLLRAVKRAIREFGMLRDGDRVAVAVSGGKDSLALLDLLQRLQAVSPVRFQLAAVHVRGDAQGVLAAHEPLAAWLAGQGIPFRIVEPGVRPEEPLPLSCQRCTWLRRKAIFLTADALDCNVVAYAHHADDAAQTTLLNLLFTGDVRTMAPAADYFRGRFRLIRPLIHIPESELARFARINGYPPPPPRCPQADHSRRRLVADMLRLLGRDYLTRARTNLIRAGLRGMGPDV
ncbi:MAG: ATP-binding protein [Anaerolineae bacterium]